MIDALIAGRLHGQPQQRTGQSGKPFSTAKIRAASGSGESVFVNAIAFNANVQAALLAMGDGDSVALSGALTPKTWTDREGVAHPALDLVAHAVVTPYHVSRKRQAAAGEGPTG